ncbi:MAG: hypothetical protein V4670_01210 [Bacteroidota bacterium]
MDYKKTMGQNNTNKEVKVTKMINSEKGKFIKDFKYGNLDS